MSEPFMTTEQLDAYLAGDQQQMIDAASAAIRAYCGWHVAPVIEETVTVRAHGGIALLPSLQVVEISAVEVDGVALTSDAYEFEQSGVLHVRRSGCQVKVTMRHGHDLAEVGDLVGVIGSMVRRGQSNPMGADMLKAVEYTAQYGGDATAGGGGLTDHQRMVLDRYKIPMRP